MNLYEELMLVLIVLSALLYAASFATALKGRAQQSFRAFAAGWLVNAAVIVGNYLLCGHPPFGNMYHVLCFLSLCFLPFYLFVERRYGLGWTMPTFSFASVIPLIGTFFLERDLAWQRIPALQSPWFVPHVLSYMIAYALATVAFLLMVIGLWQRSEHRERWSDASLQIARVAFPFMTFGLWSGALWAEEAWGIYWSWDPKETWSLITWTLYLVYFHCQYVPARRRFAPWAQILAFAALLITFLVVNLLPKFADTLHSYA